MVVFDRSIVEISNSAYLNNPRKMFNT